MVSHQYRIVDTSTQKPAAEFTIKTKGYNGPSNNKVLELAQYNAVYAPKTGSMFAVERYNGLEWQSAGLYFYG